MDAWSPATQLLGSPRDATQTEEIVDHHYDRRGLEGAGGADKSAGFTSTTYGP